CGAGGDGASGAQPAGQGADAATTNTAGGGGGGLGRVRVNWFNQPGGFPIAISAQSSTGAVTVN
ncbi:MAG: hypothetical protein KC503_21815, partial [Myxococcales bacterium]|nr:hypothetical protein [Myxococcales bacterium]